MSGHTCGQWLVFPFKYPPRASPFLDSPASLHVCISWCCFDGHLARFRNFSWLGFLWEKWNEQGYLKREQGSSFCLTYVSQKFYSERRTEKLLLPTADHGFFPHGSVILQLNILAQNRGNRDRGWTEGVGHGGSCALAPLLAKPQTPTTWAWSQGSGPVLLMHSCCGCTLGASCAPGWAPAPSTPNRPCHSCSAREPGTQER